MVNLISISGLAGSGKDEVAKIIQYLTSNDVNEVENYNEWKSYRLGLNSKGYKDNWENKKFAQKLKQIVALLIGCRVEDLENQKFKERKLGEEWRKWYYYHTWGSLADGRISNYYATEDEAKQDEINILKRFPTGAQLTSVILNPRLILQLLGTDCLRNIIHPNIHITSLFANYVSPEICICNEERKLGNIMMCFMCQEVIGSKWIISDTRYLNEIKAIKDRNGICIKIDNNRITDTGNHSSENEWKEYNDWDYILNNSNSIEDLVKEVKIMLQHFKII